MYWALTLTKYLGLITSVAQAFQTPFCKALFPPAGKQFTNL